MKLKLTFHNSLITFRGDLNTEEAIEEVQRVRDLWTKSVLQTGHGTGTLTVISDTGTHVIDLSSVCIFGLGE